jgi:hypothetical protein
VYSVATSHCRLISLFCVIVIMLILMCCSIDYMTFFNEQHAAVPFVVQFVVIELVVMTCEPDQCKIVDDSHELDANYAWSFNSLK